LLLLLCAGTASANTLSAPDTVHAGQTGAFTFTFSWTISPDSTVLAGAGWSQVTNVTGEFHGDCLCLPTCRYGPGKEFFFTVTGSLVDPMAPGSLENWVAFCGDPELRAVTTVMPYDPQPVFPTSWGRIKARYR
jgi:hypothetical protein